MSYCKITIGGKERGWKFNQMAAIILKDKTDKDFPDATAGYALVYAGLKANSYVKSEELDLSWEQVCDFTDKLSTEDVAKMSAAFMETEMYKNSIAFQEQQKKNLKRSAGRNIKAKTSR